MSHKKRSAFENTFCDHFKRTKNVFLELHISFKALEGDSTCQKLLLTDFCIGFYNYRTTNSSAGPSNHFESHIKLS